MTAETSPAVASLETARLQAWNQRVIPLLPKTLKPVAKRILLRTEFSGAGTAEEAFLAAAQIYNQRAGMAEQVVVECQSMADWFSPARLANEANNAHACRFSDIMSLAPDWLKQKLTEPLVEKATVSFELTLYLQVELTSEDLKNALGIDGKLSKKAAVNAINALFKKDGVLAFSHISYCAKVR